MLILVELTGWLIIAFEIAGHAERMQKSFNAFHDRLAQFSLAVVQWCLDNSAISFKTLAFIGVALIGLLGSTQQFGASLEYSMFVGFGLFGVILILLLFLRLMALHPKGAFGALGVLLALTTSVLSRLQ